MSFVSCLPGFPQRTLLLLLIVLCVPMLTVAQDTLPRQDSVRHTLVVGTKEAPPFSMKRHDGTWTGISIDLWREIAAELRLDFRLEERDLQGLLDGIHDSTLDVAIAAISITAEREEFTDFTHPYYQTGIGIAVRPVGQGDWFTVVRNFISLDFLKVVLLLFCTLLVVGTIIWLLERRQNPDQFEPGWKGVGSGLWWSAVTLTTVGYGDKAPTTAAGRFIAILWMISAIILVSSFTAAITSALTVNELNAAVRGPEDLVRVRVGTIEGTTAAQYLRERDIEYRTFTSARDGLRDVAQGSITAFVYDAPILKYWSAKDYSGVLTVLPNTFEKRYYAIALPRGSKLRKPINEEMIRRLNGPHWPALLGQYLDE